MMSRKITCSVKIAEIMHLSKRECQYRRWGWEPGGGGGGDLVEVGMGTWWRWGWGPGGGENEDLVEVRMRT